MDRLAQPIANKHYFFKPEVFPVQEFYLFGERFAESCQGSAGRDRCTEKT
jgi:hypothetical protein